MEVYLQSVWYIFSHLVTGLLALCGSRPWEIQSWREWRWERQKWWERGNPSSISQRELRRILADLTLEKPS